MDKPRFFIGVVCVQVRRDVTTTDQHNEVWCGAAVNEDEARGAWLRASLDKHPGGSIVYHGVWDKTDQVLAYAATTEATNER